MTGVDETSLFQSSLDLKLLFFFVVVRHLKLLFPSVLIEKGLERVYILIPFEP